MGFGFEYERNTFFKHQKRLCTQIAHLLIPDSIEEYSGGGLQALAKMVGWMTPEEVLRPGTRKAASRQGGGGFTTARNGNSHSATQS
jgi:hypothetical protein